MLKVMQEMSERLRKILESRVMIKNLKKLKMMEKMMKRMMNLIKMMNSTEIQWNSKKMIIHSVLKM